jgi:nucleotide-binding universal stress UspA family protein
LTTTTHTTLTIIDDLEAIDVRIAAIQDHLAEERAPLPAEVLVGPESLVSASVVARATLHSEPRGRVVVGLRRTLDGPEALAVGFAEAERRGLELMVTMIRDDATADRGVDGLEPAFHAADQTDVDAAEDLFEAVLSAGRAFPTVEVTTSLRTGHFADVLVELSRSADLVVLGMGRRPTGMGRTDLVVATHAACPVIVVRESSTEGGS